MKKEIIIKKESEKYRTLNDLRNCLSLPEEIHLTDDELINFIDIMKDPDHIEVIKYRYILGYSFKEIDDTIDLYHGNLNSFCKTAVKTLRKNIMNHYFPPDYNDLMLYDIVFHKISNRLGLSGKTVKEAKEWLMEFDYVASKDIDSLVEAIWKYDSSFPYPKFLLHNPPYPYNLYSYLLRERNKKKIPVKTLYTKYMQKIIYNPNNTFHAYFNHVDEIFSENNLYMKIVLSEKDLLFTKMYFKDKISIQDISQSLSVSESAIKAAVYKIIDILNGEIGNHYIHYGFPIK